MPRYYPSRYRGDNARDISVIADVIGEGGKAWRATPSPSLFLGEGSARARALDVGLISRINPPFEKLSRRNYQMIRGLPRLIVFIATGNLSNRGREEEARSSRGAAKREELEINSGARTCTPSSLIY